MSYDALVVGAGYAGSVLAERLATQLGYRVLVVDRRPHIAGNAYDELNEEGLLVHRYGPHIFHTNSAEIYAYLSRFTEWRHYEHRVLAQVRGQLVPIPINRTTVNALFGRTFSTDDEVRDFYDQRAEPNGVPRTSEDVVVGAVGRELYELFFRGYTRKQWGLDPAELDASVTARIPTRTNTDDRYFTDKFQAMPQDGYRRMFENILGHPRIEVRLGVDFNEVRHSVDHGMLIYTGPIDAYFDYRFGRLPYRSLHFEFETLDVEQFQPTGTVNYPDERVPFTRVTEFKHLTGQQHDATVVVREYPQAYGEPFYPIPRPENNLLYDQYRKLAEATPNVHFVGRLATYRYYNMDQVVGQALATFRRIAEGVEKAA